MGRIDQETIRRILDTADIVEVVSDFVSLKRRGANYVGLCPFHNERTPSFSVNRAKGFCHCFSCHKGGGPVNFLMELEQLSYVEALRYLAKKYNIEIKEEELSAQEREAASQRESMLAANEFAMRRFETNMTNTDDGRDIGLAYFRERGINEASIRKFHLGYAIDRSADLLDAARAEGFSDDILVATGLEVRTDDGRMYDRFKGRVMYPVLSLSGKIVAFGGRTLRNDKNIAKYVNSPESKIYSKSRELYGLYQSRQAIAKKDRCILVEGYMDVISMHQSGIENVVASSGTALTEGQIRLIRRFTPNITVIYDSDAAGIKASLRSIDLLLAEGMNVKILSLPDGDDPDSFAQTHSASEVEEYLAANEVDFIKFKTDILLKESGNSDPLQRARVVQDILRSIAVIPDNIVRQAYIQETGRHLSMPDTVLALQVDKIRAENAIENDKRAAQQRNREQFESRRTEEQKRDELDLARHAAATVPVSPPAAATDAEARARKRHTYYCFKPERALLTLVLRYGMMRLCEVYDQDGNSTPMNVIEYVSSEFEYDNFCFETPEFAAVWNSVVEIFKSPQREADYNSFMQSARARFDENMRKGTEEIRHTANDIDDIHRLELALREECNAKLNKETEDFEADYISKALINSPDDVLRNVTSELVCEIQPLSKIHSKYAPVADDRERLTDLVPGAMSALKNAILECEYDAIREKLAAASDSPDEYLPLMARQQQLKQMIKEMAHYLGDRIIHPRYKF